MLPIRFVSAMGKHRLERTQCTLCTSPGISPDLEFRRTRLVVVYHCSQSRVEKKGAPSNDVGRRVGGPPPSATP